MLAELFSDDPYKFQMRFSRGITADFYGPTADHERLLKERRASLDEARDRHVAVLPGCEEALDEAGELTGHPQDNGRDSLERCFSLGLACEPDILILTSQAGHIPKLRAGCVCFPSSWDLKEKMGLSVGQIHAVVPGLNQSIGSQIDGFLSKIKPGISWNRVNWGLSRSPDLNQHPERKLARLDEAATESEVFLRVEYQSLASLPRSKGILFGIRLAVHPLSEVKAEAKAIEGLANALRTMPEDMAIYKGIFSARKRILRMLES